jgi:hypothetical protein
MRETVGLGDRQRVHIGAQRNAAVGIALPEGRDDAMSANPGLERDTHLCQPLHHEPGGLRFLERKFRMRMQVVAPARQGGVELFVHLASSMCRMPVHADEAGPDAGSAWVQVSADRQTAGIGDRLKHVLMLRPTRAGDVECCAVVDRSAVDRQAQRDVHGGIERHQFHRDVALIVVLRHHEVERAIVGPVEHGIG